MGAAERANAFNQWKADGGGNTKEAYDRFGRLLSADDLIYLIGKQDAMWRIVQIRPVLDPKAPPGLVELTLATSVITGVQGGAPLQDVIKVRDAEEVRKFLSDQPKAEAPPA